MPSDDKGYTTLKDMIEGIVKYICKHTNCNDYFVCGELMGICTLIFEELFTNKSNQGFDYRFWLYDPFDLLRIASYSLYLKYQDDDNYGGLTFPCYERDDDKLLLDKLDKYLKDNNKYNLEPHDFNYHTKFFKHMVKVVESDEVGMLLDYIRKNSPT